MTCNRSQDLSYSPVQACRKQRARAVKKRWILTGSTSAVLRQLTVPMLWAILALFSADLIELYFASRLGVEELTAMSFTLPVQATLFAFAIGLGIVVATRLTQARVVEELAAVSLIFTVLVGATIALGIWLNLLPILNLLGFADFSEREKVWGPLNTYMQYRLGAVIFFFLIMVIFGVLRAFGNMRAAAQLLVVFAGMQVLTSAALFSPWVGADLAISGLEKLGIAHLVAAVTGCIWALYLLIVKENISIKINLLSTQSRQGFRCLFRLLIPIVSMQLLTPLAQSILMAIVATQGSDAVAAYGVVMRLEPLALLLPMVLTTSLPIFVGQNWEANKALRVRRGIKLSVLVCIVWQLVVSLVLFFGADLLGVGFCQKTFVSKSIELALTVLPLSYIALAATMLYVSCCNATGRSMIALNVSILRLFGLSIPFAYFGAYVAGFSGIVWGLALANVILGLGLLAYCVLQRERLMLSKQAAMS
ncbi:MATE family efflux transporter [Pseudoalteromonas luteoviolacea]|uniref:Na+-driven multidrug efflux pump n=1 Tax=Pseudoalteromonas luteoviolacea (strain 2ta16) TaxID=1353533 RepID=V4HN35_PSEL2|nr:MATE family efflux transporter [Pseudoalteromonas luteoviolacea]ESP92245.1 Na+-driven multidrug efflux pump [Pseudoalteromonas luteoviolacea 2ta16]KZN29354.1 hypothetical protein N483_07920 [Pseudoalteromonas luteoviolacea NCIMB 1944]